MLYTYWSNKLCPTLSLSFVHIDLEFTRFYNCCNLKICEWQLKILENILPVLNKHSFHKKHWIYCLVYYRHQKYLQNIAFFFFGLTRLIKLRSHQTHFLLMQTLISIPNKWICKILINGWISFFKTNRIVRIEIRYHQRWYSLIDISDFGNIFEKWFKYSAQLFQIANILKALRTYWNTFAF